MKGKIIKALPDFSYVHDAAVKSMNVRQRVFQKQEY